MPIERVPSNPLPLGYVPPGGVPYRVKDGDDWHSVAMQNRVNVYSLIRFNFETEVPDEVNWYLRRKVGCTKPSPDGNNWKFSSDAHPGIIYIPPPRDIDIDSLEVKWITRSIATLSWIDPRSNLPEVDSKGNPGAMIRRGAILARQGYPSYPYPIQRKMEYVDRGVRFKQIAGARTQSAEVLTESIFGPFAPVPEMIAEAIYDFPPIWTELELTIYVDGTYDGRLVRHSFFPSVAFYYGGRFSTSFPHVEPIELDGPAEEYYRIIDYDGVTNYSNWREKGFGPLSTLPSAPVIGPTGGNPWGVTRPEHDSNAAFGR